MQDEAFHEIQLNGKQLVFLFMAGTVVAVVIFLCGVMVGRGVPVARAGEATVAAGTDTAIDPTFADVPAASASTTGVPLSAQETLTYAGRLEDATPPAEALRPAVTSASDALAPPAVTEPAPVEPPPPDVTATAGGTTFAEPRGSGWVVQVAAVRERAEAEMIARRLAARGYPSFISTPAADAPTFFRVRVGKYEDRRDAESIAGRLEREERFNPWITQ